jgi:hypothetical protein
MLISNNIEIDFNNRKKSENELELKDLSTLVYKKENFYIPEKFRLTQRQSVSVKSTFCFTTEVSHKVFIFGIGAGLDE